MPNPYPQAVFANKRFNWSFATNPAQHAIWAPVVNQAGDIFLSPHDTLPNTPVIMKVSGTSLNKVSEISSGLNNYNSTTGLLLPNGKFLYTKEITNDRWRRFTADGGAEAESAVLFDDAGTGQGNNFGFYAGNNFGYLQRNGAAAQRVLFDPDTMTPTLVGAPIGTILLNATVYDSVNNKLFGAEDVNRVNRYTVAFALEATVAIGGNLTDIVFAFGSIWAASRGGGAVYRINPVTMAITNTFVLMQPRALTFNSRHIFVFVDQTGGALDGGITVIDPNTNTVEHTFTGVISEGVVLKATWMKYDPIFNRIIAVKNTNENEVLDNFTALDLEPTTRRNRRSGGELWSMIPEMKDYLG